VAADIDIPDDFGQNTFEGLQNHIDFAAGNMLSSELTVEQAGAWYEEFTDAMRAHALLWLLVKADAQTCFRDLTFSAHVRRHFLQKSKRHQQVTYYCTASRMAPFLDAVAAESTDVARDIAALTPPEWMERDEYEDDFCYARFLHLWVTGGTPPEEMAEILDRFERALEGAPSTRLDVCRALLARQEPEFRDAFDALIAERQDEVKAKLERIVANPVVTLDCQVFVEGLALLRLADGLGFRTEPEYPGCPKLARARSKVGRLPDRLPPP
jgi:Immunity protein 49